MEPNFDRTDRKIGRKRLPQGYVAVLDDREQTGAEDRQGIHHKRVDLFGPASVLEQAAIFGVGDASP